MYHVPKMSCTHFRRPQPRISKGFTLIELLVVVSIIALLVAILVPALTEAQEAAQSVVCQSNLHQIALATQIYTDDNGGAFFWQRGTEPNQPTPYNYKLYRPWFHADGVLSPYIQGGAEAIARYGCPTHENNDEWYDGDFIANRHIVGLPAPPGNDPAFGWPSKLARIRKPSRKIVIAEMVQYGPVNYSHPPDGFDFQKGLGLGDHHQGGNNNILWADMHVEPILKRDLEWNTPNLIDPFTWLYRETN